MSTRGFVAIGKPGGTWDGRYNHSDSYPTWLGEKVFEEAKRWLHNDGHLHGFAQKLLAAHRWEQFTGEDCDGNKSDHITPENADWLFMEWGYLTFSPRLKPGDSFSVLVGRATPHVRGVPHTNGGRHNPDYWA